MEKFYQIKTCIGKVAQGNDIPTNTTEAFYRTWNFARAMFIQECKNMMGHSDQIDVLLYSLDKLYTDERYPCGSFSAELEVPEQHETQYFTVDLTTEEFSD